MTEYGIETGTHYKPIHTFSLYKSKIKLKNTENVGKSVVTIPCHTNLNETEIEKIIRLTNKFSWDLITKNLMPKMTKNQYWHEFKDQVKTSNKNGYVILIWAFEK